MAVSLSGKLYHAISYFTSKILKELTNGEKIRKYLVILKDVWYNEWVELCAHAD